jgi:hypothetical protein
VDYVAYQPVWDAWEGWLLGSEEFLKSIKQKFQSPRQPDQVRLIRRAEKHLAQSRQDRNLAARIVETITKTENWV